MLKSNIPDGALLWLGKSLFNNKELAVVLTGITKFSQNVKTGPMIQSFVIPIDVSPTEAIVTGKDDTVCGNCPLRRKVCYVNPMGVNGVYHKLQRGGYPPLNEEILNYIKIRQLKLRITAYGDAAATPIEMWQPIIKAASGATGYTHAWRTCDQRWSKHLMASVEKAEDVNLANSKGWRTYRVKQTDTAILSSEIACPNSINPMVQCITCRLCNGASKQANIVEDVHGLMWKQNNFAELKLPT